MTYAEEVGIDATDRRGEPLSARRERDATPDGHARTTPAVSIICPVHDEEGSLSELVSRIRQTLDDRLGPDAWEVLLVDDVSNDGSWNVMTALADADPRVHILRHERRLGQTGGFATGFAHARGDVVVTMDADLQVFPEDIPLLLDTLQAGALELVNAIRARRRDAAPIRAASWLYNRLMRIFFGHTVEDAASNFTAIRRTFLRQLPLTGNDHRYIIPILQSRGISRIGEVAVRHQERRTGRSKYGMKKAFTGFPELVAAFLRIRRGVYAWQRS